MVRDQYHVEERQHLRPPSCRARGIGTEISLETAAFPVDTSLQKCGGTSPRVLLQDAAGPACRDFELFAATASCTRSKYLWNVQGVCDVRHDTPDPQTQAGADLPSAGIRVCLL